MAAEKAEQKRKLARDLEVELGEDYHMDMRNHWDLKIPDEKHDVLPEIFLGKNVADFIDPDIMKVCALFNTIIKLLFLFFTIGANICATLWIHGFDVFLFSFSNLLIIHEEETEEINTVKEVCMDM